MNSYLPGVIGESREADGRVRREFDGCVRHPLNSAACAREAYHCRSTSIDKTRDSGRPTADPGGATLGIGAFGASNDRLLSERLFSFGVFAYVESEGISVTLCIRPK